MAYPWGFIIGHCVVKKFITFMKIQGSLPCFHDTSTGPCSEPDESTQHPHIIPLVHLSVLTSCPIQAFQNIVSVCNCRIKFCTFLFHAFKYKFYNIVSCGASEVKSVTEEVIDCDYYYFCCYIDDNEGDAQGDDDDDQDDNNNRTLNRNLLCL